MRLNSENESKVDRVLSNQTLSSTVSLLTSNIPFPWFLVLGCNREAPLIIRNSASKITSGASLIFTLHFLITFYKRKKD